MGYEKVSRLDVFNIQTKDERVTFDSKHLTKRAVVTSFIKIQVLLMKR